MRPDGGRAAYNNAAGVRMCYASVSEEGVPVGGARAAGSHRWRVGAARVRPDCVILAWPRMNDVESNRLTQPEYQGATGRPTKRDQGAVEEDGFFYAPEPVRSWPVPSRVISR